MSSVGAFWICDASEGARTSKSVAGAAKETETELRRQRAVVARLNFILTIVLSMCVWSKYMCLKVRRQGTVEECLALMIESGDDRSRGDWKDTVRSYTQSRLVSIAINIMNRLRVFLSGRYDVVCVDQLEGFKSSSVSEIHMVELKFCDRRQP